MPGEEHAWDAPARRADALVALLGGDRGGCRSRSRHVVHAQLDGLGRDAGGCEIDEGPAVAPAA